MNGPGGPYDVDELPEDGQLRLDVGSLLIAAPRGQQVQLGVDERTRQVHSVHVIGDQGAAEIRAFAAPRTGSRWAVVRGELIAQAAAEGVRLTQRMGPFGVELMHPRMVSSASGGDDSAGEETPPSRVIGIDGPRWLLRITLMGRPAERPEDAADWDELISLIGVRRGSGPMPVGAPLPLTLPTDAVEG